VRQLGGKTLAGARRQYGCRARKACA